MDSCCDRYGHRIGSARLVVFVYSAETNHYPPNSSSDFKLSLDLE